MQSNNNFYIKTKTLITPRCLLRALWLICWSMPCPFESELSTVTTSVSRWWRPMLPPRKRHRAINRDKPKADDFPADISPPLVLPRRGDAGYSGSVKDWLVRITLVLWKTGWCGLLWFCERLVDAGYSGSVKDWLVQIILVNDKSMKISLLWKTRNDNISERIVLVDLRWWISFKISRIAENHGLVCTP